MPAVDDVVAVAALDVVVAADVGDDVVAGAAEEVVVAVAAFEPVVAAVAPERVVAVAGDEDVVAGGAAEDDVLVAGVVQIVGVGARRGRDCRGSTSGVISSVDRSWMPPVGIGAAVQTPSARLNCLRLVDLEHEGRRREDVAPADASRRCCA